MGASNIDGPLYRYGPMGSLAAATYGSAVGDPNPDAGPGGSYQGEGYLDPRFFFSKDQMRPGSIANHFMLPTLRSISQIPAALAANNIAAAQAPAAGVALTLATRSVGVERSIPMLRFNAGGLAAGTIATAGVTLDFGFAWGTVVSGSKNVTVANTYDFFPGMPIVIAGVGNSGGTVPLLTNVVSITSTTVMVIADAPSASLNPAPIGTGNIWGPAPSSSFVTPTAALPWIAGGPGAFLDARQAVARNVRVVGLANGIGGVVTIAGADIYGQSMSEAITLAAGANTVYGVKAYKYIFSATPNFTDTINVTVGTGDVFGFHYRAPQWEETEVFWNAIAQTVTQGYTAPLALITAPTTTNADIRGTIQTGAAGAGTGIGATASNGTVSALAMSGVRLLMQQKIGMASTLFATPADARTLFGTTQA